MSELVCLVVLFCSTAEPPPHPPQKNGNSKQEKQSYRGVAANEKLLPAAIAKNTHPQQHQIRSQRKKHTLLPVPAKVHSLHQLCWHFCIKTAAASLQLLQLRS